MGMLPHCSVDYVDQDKDMTMEERTMKLTESLAKRLNALAKAHGVEVSDAACFLLTRALA
jgi:hypothetical protein